MSEYQYYEFRAIDSPLDREQMDELRAISTRAEITPVRFTNTYHFGDLKGKPADMVHRYFDAFVYVANWGTNELIFKLPEGFIDTDLAEAYCDEEVVSITRKHDCNLIKFFSNLDEGGDYEDWGNAEKWLPSLITLRADLMRGDLRALYLGWLASLPARYWDDDCLEEKDENEDDDRLEPPVPAGLTKLSAALRALTDFLRVDDLLLKVAAAGSVGEPVSAPTRAEMEQWVKKLPVAEKDVYLTRLLSEESNASLRAEIFKQFREATAPRGKARVAVEGRRTVGQLLTARNALAKKEIRKNGEQEARAKAEREEEEKQKRRNHLAALSRREANVWDEIGKLIAMKNPKSYDRVVTYLSDLREIAEQKGQADEFATRLLALRHEHKTKLSFLERLDKKNLR